MTTLMQVNRQWSTRPADQRFVSLTDLQKKARADRENSIASVISTRDLKVIPHPADPVKGITIEGKTGLYDPTHFAFGRIAALAKAPGLGKKGAQKIILELKGSIDLSQIEGSSATASTPEDTGAEQVVEGLMSLGWHQQDAVHAVQTVCADNQIETPLNAEDVPRVLKLALTSLDRGR